MKSASALLALAAIIGLSACSSMVHKLRPDYYENEQADGGPVRGGQFSEGGMLESDNGESPGKYGGQGTWLNDDSNMARRYYRAPVDGAEERAPTYSNRPSLPSNSSAQYAAGHRATRDDFIDHTREDGSLWTSNGQTNYFLTKNKIRGVGDIVTIKAEDPMVKDIAEEIKRTLSENERDAELDVAQEAARRKALGLPDPNDPNAKKDPAQQAAQNANDPSRSPASSMVDVPDVKWNEVDLTKSIEFKSGDPLMAEVLERYPNGNYKIRGLKRVRFRGSYRMVNVLAIARAADITDNDEIPSGKLYEYKLETVR